MGDADLIIHNAGQLVTCASGGKPKRGTEMLDVAIVGNGAVAIVDGKFAGVGPSQQVLANFQSDEMIDADGRVVCPGFVDPHTHIVYAGDRLNEFDLKIRGAEYLDIIAAGGGIVSTVASTRKAPVGDLVKLTARRINKMLACGTTTAEIKTGYGLNSETELKMLDAMEGVYNWYPFTIVPTFMPAHAVPPEYKNNPDKYVSLICETMLSQAWKWFVGSSFYRKTPFFCDVFCESGAFTLAQTRKILETAKSLGFRLKAHVDQFTNLGGSRLAIEMGATSIDHLDAISDEDIAMLASSETVGVVIPTENFSAGKTKFAPARKLVDMGCAVALTTDYNPGSAPCPSQAMAMAIAARYQKLLPAECLNAATINAAHAIGMGDQFGSIEVGKRADVVMLDMTDHREIVYEFGGEQVKTVIKEGKQIL